MRWLSAALVNLAAGTAAFVAAPLVGLAMLLDEGLRREARDLLTSDAVRALVAAGVVWSAVVAGALVYWMVAVVAA